MNLLESEYDRAILALQIREERLKPAYNWATLGAHATHTPDAINHPPFTRWEPTAPLECCKALCYTHKSIYERRFPNRHPLREHFTTFSHLAQEFKVEISLLARLSKLGAGNDSTTPKQEILPNV